MTVASADDLVAAIEAAANARRGSAPRLMVAIAGPPGAGKSTLTEALAARLDQTAVMPMDGFHLDNATLRARGLLHRKGAPESFDPAQMTRLLQQVRSGGPVMVPTFDRAADAVVPEGRMIPAETRIVLVEGNYLLLDAPEWRKMHILWDITVMLDVAPNELERRLIQRWLDHGLSADDATRRARDNDLRNANTVLTGSVCADYTILQNSASGLNGR